MHAQTIQWSLKESMMSCGLNLPGCILSTRQLIHTHPPSRSFLGLSWIIRARQSPGTLTGVSATPLSGTHQPRSTIKSDHSSCHAAFTHHIDINCLITSDHQLLHDLHCSFTADGASSVPAQWRILDVTPHSTLWCHFNYCMSEKADVTSNKWMFNWLRSLL